MEEKEIIRGKVGSSAEIMCKLSRIGLVSSIVGLIVGVISEDIVFLCLGTFLIIDSIFLALYSFNLTKTEIVVTNFRVYGKTFLGGKRVDLPMNSISATGIKGKNCVYIGTSAGRINFGGLENAEEVYKAINKLLSEKQTVQIGKNYDEIDKIKKYKELLDMGVITPEEFEVKKKELLK